MRQLSSPSRPSSSRMSSFNPGTFSPPPSTFSPLSQHGNGTTDDDGSEKPIVAAGAAGATTTRSAKPRPPAKKGRTCWGFGHVAKGSPTGLSNPKADAVNGEKGDVEGEAGQGGGGKRKIQLLAPLYGGLACAMSFCEWGDFPCSHLLTLHSFRALVRLCSIYGNRSPCVVPRLY